MQGYASQREGCDQRPLKSQGTNGLSIERKPGFKGLDVRISGRSYYFKDLNRIPA
jgi:hypothetical protein